MFPTRPWSRAQLCADLLTMQMAAGPTGMGFVACAGSCWCVQPHAGQGSTGQGTGHRLARFWPSWDRPIGPSPPDSGQCCSALGPGTRTQGARVPPSSLSALISLLSMPTGSSAHRELQGIAGTCLHSWQFPLLQVPSAVPRCWLQPASLALSPLSGICHLGLGWSKLGGALLENEFTPHTELHPPPFFILRQGLRISCLG